MLTGSTTSRSLEVPDHKSTLLWTVFVFLGALIAPLASSAAFSLLPNGSFEQGLNGWTSAPLAQTGGAAAITPETQQVRHGTRSLRLDVVGPASASVASESFPVDPGSHYLLSLLYRADGISSSGKHQGVSSLVGIRWLDAGGAMVDELQIGLPYGSRPWNHVLRLVTAPGNARAVLLRVQLFASADTLPSSVWIDDVRFRPWVTEPVDGVASWGWSIADKKQHDIQYRAVADEDTASKTSVVANPAYHEAGFQLVSGGVFDKQLTPGAYRVDVRLKVSSNGSSSPLARLSVVANAVTNFTVASAAIAANDFDAALTYQEISLPILRPVEGFVSPRLIWDGEIALWIDTLRIVPERLSNENEFVDLFGPQEFPVAEEEPDPPGPPTLTIDPLRYADPETPSELRPRTAGYMSANWLFHRDYSIPRLSWLKRESPYPNLDVNLQLAFYFAFMHHVSGSLDDAQHAREFIGEAHLLRNSGISQQTSAVIHIGRIWKLLEEGQALNTRTRQQLSELLVALVPRFPAETVQYGNSNRPLGKALVGEILLAHAPDAPDAALWREYVETLWDGFWLAKDTRENAGNYNALSFSYLIDWVEQRGAAAQFYADPAIQALFERFMLQILPIGSLPHYGDTNGWNVEWGHWIHVMEVVAAESGDARFRWAAERLFEYAVSRIENIHSWSYTGTSAIESLMLAQRAADFSLTPVPPTQDVVALRRARIDPLPPETPTNQGQFSVDPSQRAPSKIMMRSDDSKDSTALLLELDRHAGHGPPTAPSLIALVDRGAVLLMDHGYTESEAQFHNMLWLEDYVGIPLDEGAEEIRILETASVGSLRYAKVRVDRFRGYPAALERSVVLAREGPALIVDTLRFEEAFTARLGQVFNLGVVGPEIGETWVNGYIGDFVPVRGIGENTPVYTRWFNPPRDLLVYFIPQADATLDLFDRSQRDLTNPLPMRVRYTHRGDVAAGSELAFASVLVPHTPISTPSDLAQTVRVAQHTPESTAVSTASLEDGSRVWLSAGPVNSPTLLTDANAAVAVELEGEIVAGGMTGGSYLRLSGSHSQLLADGTLATAMRRINAGASVYVDSLGDPWWPDHGFQNGSAVQSNESVGGTSDPLLYETQRSAGPGEDALRFALFIQNGAYVVRLHFAAIDGGPGRCSFDVALEEQLLVAGLDVAGEAGASKAFSIDFDVVVADHRLDIELLRGIGDPKIAGIEILVRN